MKKHLALLLLLVLPLLVAAQNPTVPTTLDFAGLRLRLSNGGRRAVQEKVDALLRHPASFQARVTLADAYFPLIDRVFQEEGVPVDFRYLAIQESGLQGNAQSIHDAVGYWQFKREAATDFGLVMSGQVDERKHIVTASHAAAKYLLRSNASLHNWLNTLLSYNLGLGGVKSYTLPTDYNATEMTVSEQTHPYVLTFLAHKLAFEPAVGLNPTPALLLQEFPAQAGQSLSAMAFGLQTEADAFIKHNPWLASGAVVPTDRPYTVLVPITDPTQLTALAAQQRTATTGQLLEQPAADPKNPEYVLINGLRAIIALPGETKEDLARRADMRLRRFLRFNDLLAFDNVVAGQPYFVQRKRDKAAVEYHSAQPGESVAAVSQKYGVRAQAILNKNRMARTEQLRPGRVLWLQHTRPRDVAVEYTSGQNAVAAAALERPVTAPTPAPATPAAPQNQASATTAAASEELNEEMEAADSTANEATENLNELPTAAPTIDPPARNLYGGRSTAAAPRNPAPAPSKEPFIEAPAAVVLRDPDAPRGSTTPRPATVPGAAASPVTTKVEPVPVTGVHIVEKSESLYSIGRRYGVRPADLAAWNPDLPGDLSLRLGQTLRVVPPGAGSATPATPPASTTPKAAPAATPTAAPAPAGTEVRHTVVAGESMYGISRKYGVTINQIIEWNGKPDFNVRPGEVLIIRQPR